MDAWGAYMYQLLWPKKSDEWTLQFSGIWHCVGLYIGVTTLEELTASIFKAIHRLTWRCSQQGMVPIYQATRRTTSDECNFHQHPCENIKSRINFTLSRNNYKKSLPMPPFSYIYTWHTLVPAARNPVQKSLFPTYGLLSSKIETLQSLATQTPRFSVVNTLRFCLNVYSDIRVSNLCVVLLSF